MMNGSRWMAMAATGERRSALRVMQGVGVVLALLLISQSVL